MASDLLTPNLEKIKSTLARAQSKGMSCELMVTANGVSPQFTRPTAFEERVAKRPRGGSTMLRRAPEVAQALDGLGFRIDADRTPDGSLAIDCFLLPAE